MDDSMLTKYAKLLVHTGVNLQKGQPLVVTADIQSAPLVRKVADAAYDAGASQVVIRWEDDYLTQSKFLRASEEVFKVSPPWVQSFYDYYDQEGACYIFIDTEDPDLLKDANPERIKNSQASKNKALVQHRKMTMGNHVRWSIGAMPSVAWAKKMFPDVPEAEAMDKLGQAIAKASRLDTEDPVAAWAKHIEAIKSREKMLDSYNFKSLTYANSLGTNLTIELPENHQWQGTGEQCRNGFTFSANIPSEEIYTAPKNTGVNGHVVASMPLIYHGVAIDKFSLTFKDGKVVDFKAEQNEETLKHLLEMDEGACMLGEVALVPYDSPISQMGLLFYNTLFDENASCHLALGKAYPTCLRNSDNMDKEALEKAGLNDSIIHVDFMIGTADLSITGTKADGQKVTVFKNGNFAF